MRGRGRWLLAALPALPVLLFAALGFFLWRGLSLEPGKIPSVLINKPAPEITLPPLPGRDNGLSRADLTGQVSLLNVFASWCVACRVEHPLLLALANAADGPAIYGLNYKDEPAAALQWLTEMGDPYDRIGVDRNGRAAIELGVYGVPESFVINRDGVIVYKIIGPITPSVMEAELRPLLKKLAQ